MEWIPEFEIVAANLVEFTVVLTVAFMGFMLLLLPVRAALSFAKRFITGGERQPKVDKQTIMECGYFINEITVDGEAYIWLADTDIGRLNHRSFELINCIRTSLKGNMQPEEIVAEFDGTYYSIHLGSYYQLFVSELDEQHVLGTPEEINNYRLHALKYLIWQYTESEDIHLLYERYVYSSIKVTILLTILFIVKYLFKFVLKLYGNEALSKPNAEALVKP